MIEKDVVFEKVSRTKNVFTKKKNGTHGRFS